MLIVSNTVGNLLLAIGMQRMPDFQAVGLLRYLGDLAANLWVLSGIALLIVWMIAQLSMFTWADLTYVLPMTAFAYVLTAVLAKYFLNEQISLKRWIGIALITLGVVFVAETPERTRSRPADPS